MNRMLTRAARASILDRKPFQEAFFDADAVADSAILVSVVALVGYVTLLVRLGGLGVFSLAGALQSVIGGVVSWLILGFATWFAATRLFSAKGRPQTVIALQGLAVLPLALQGFGTIAATLALVWYLAVLVVATREAVDLSMRDSSLSVLIGLALAALTRAMIGAPFAVFSA